MLLTILLAAQAFAGLRFTAVPLVSRSKPVANGEFVERVIAVGSTSSRDAAFNQAMRMLALRVARDAYQGESDTFEQEQGAGEQDTVERVFAVSPDLIVVSVSTSVPTNSGVPCLGGEALLGWAELSPYLRRRLPFDPTALRTPADR